MSEPRIKSRPHAGQHWVHYSNREDEDARWYCGTGSGGPTPLVRQNLPLCEECIKPDAPQAAQFGRSGGPDDR